MGLSARVPSTILTNLFIPALFSKQVAEAVHSELVCTSVVDTSFKSELAKGNILYIPKSNTVAAAEVVVGTAGTATNPANTTGVTLTIDQWWEVPINIDHMSLIQQNVDLVAMAKREAVYGIKKKIDTTVNTLFSALGGSSVLGADGVAVTDNVLLQAWETLAKNDVPMDDGNISIVCNPSTIVDFMKEDKLVSSLYGQVSPSSAGFRGFHKVYGIPVYVTNNLTAATTGAYCAMLHKKAIACVIQEEPVVQVIDVPREHQAVVLVSALWGVIEVRDTFGVAFYSRSK